MFVNEGIKSFYKGFLPSIFLSFYGVIQMFSYENINFLLGYNPKEKNQNMAIPFLTGGFSKCVASACLLPLNVIRLRL
jgi:hypothetical protein